MKPSVFLCLLSLWLVTICNAGSVRLFSGENYEAKIDVDSSGISATRDKNPSIHIDLNNVIELHFGKPPTSVNCPPGFLLVNGSFVPGIPPDLDEPTVKIGNPPLVVPTASIARIVYTATPFDKVLQPSGGKTGVILPNGDFFVGTFDGIKDKRAVVINSIIFGPQQFLKTNPFALVLRDVQTSPTRFEVISKDKRFLVDDLRVESGGFSLRDSVVGNVHIDAKDMVSIRAGSARWQAVTALKPSSVEVPKGADASNAVHVIAADETKSQPSPALLTAIQAAVSYRVPAGLSLFTCRAEIPKEIPPGLRFSFAVYGDGKPLFRSPLIGSGDVTQSLRVGIATCQTITLRVEPVKPTPGTMFGRWIDPLLLRP